MHAELADRSWQFEIRLPDRPSGCGNDPKCFSVGEQNVFSIGSPRHLGIPWQVTFHRWRVQRLYLSAIGRHETQAWLPVPFVRPQDEGEPPAVGRDRDGARGTRAAVKLFLLSRSGGPPDDLPDLFAA